FLPEKELLKQIKTIKTDSTPMEAPKDPDNDNVYAIYSLLATDEEKSALRAKYLAGNFGYGHAKQELYELIVRKFDEQRKMYAHLMSHPEELERQLALGENKA